MKWESEGILGSVKYISNLRGMETYNVLEKLHVGIENMWRREEGQELYLVFTGRELSTKSNYKIGLCPVVNGGGFNSCELLMAIFSTLNTVPTTQWTQNIFSGNIFLNACCYLKIRILVLEHGEE